MQLIDVVRNHPTRMVVPLMGYPGAQLTHSTLWQNGINSELQFRSVKALYDTFQPDMLFFMMDLAVEAGAIGLPIHFPLNESPTVVKHPVKCAADLEAFKVLDPTKDGRVRTYIDVMRRMTRELDTFKGAYVIGPFTMAGLMMGATEIAMATLDNPDLVHTVLEFATGVIERYAAQLVDAGADAVCILEPTATFISPAAFEEFSGQYNKRIIATQDTRWILHICGNTTHLIPGMCATGAQGLSLDAAVDFPAIVSTIPEDVVLIGNVDPVRIMVNETQEGVWNAVTALLDAMAPYPNFILSTGCDLPVETPLENIMAFMNAGRVWQPERQATRIAVAR